MRTCGRGQSSLLLLDVVGVLSRMNIPYAVIGAFAVSFHGIVRASLAADLVISLRNVGADIRSLTAALRDAGFQALHRSGEANDPIRHVIKVSDIYANQVDILNGIRGMDEKAFGRVVVASFEDTSLSLISAEDLIAMKLFAGSPQDVVDAQGLLHLLSESLDKNLLKGIVRRYGKSTERRLLSLSPL